jgi:hypothetical protein
VVLIFKKNQDGEQRHAEERDQNGAATQSFLAVLSRHGGKSFLISIFGAL